MKLNDYYYFANEELEKYYESWNARFLVNAAKWYITYKRQGGKRTIKRLDDLIASIQDITDYVISVIVVIKLLDKKEGKKMKNYNYLESMKEDIKEYIKENYNTEDYTKEDMQTRLYDELWCEDSVTGNGSGSYTFNTQQAKEYVLNNDELLEETIKEFEINMNEHFGDWEYLDVSIRCYLLGQAIEEVMKELYY